MWIDKQINELTEKKESTGLTSEEQESLDEYEGRRISIDYERDYFNGEVGLWWTKKLNRLLLS